MKLFSEAYLSEEDRDLIGSQSSRDPLGLMAIWSHFGRKIIYNLTETSNHAMGFQLLIASLKMYEMFCVQENKWVNQRNFFLLMEQYFAYSYALKNGPAEYPLPGKRALVGRPQEDYALSFQHKLLQGQLGNGVWGLFRGAAERSGLISFCEKKDVLCDDVSIEISEDDCKILFNDIRKVMENDIDLPLKKRTNARSRGGLFSSLSNILETLPQRELLREKLINKFPKQTIISRIIKEEFFSPEIKYRDFIKAIRDEIEEPDLIQNIEEIENCENYLAIIASVFDYLCTMDGQSIDSVVNRTGRFLNLNKLTKAQKSFKQLPCNSNDTVRNRINMLGGEVIIATSFKECIQTLVQYHEHLMEKRHNEAWITIESNGVLVVSQKADPFEPDWNIGETWRHDYFFSSLRNIKRTLRREAS